MAAPPTPTTAGPRCAALTGRPRATCSPRACDERPEDAAALDGLGRALWWMEPPGRERRREAYALYRRRGETRAAANLAIYLAGEHRIAGEPAAASGGSRAPSACSRPRDRAPRAAGWRSSSPSARPACPPSANAAPWRRRSWRTSWATRTWRPPRSPSAGSRWSTRATSSAGSRCSTRRWPRPPARRRTRSRSATPAVRRSWPATGSRTSSAPRSGAAPSSASPAAAATPRCTRGAAPSTGAC